MTVGDFLRRLSEALDRAKVPYMVTGSMVSTYYGEPRTTQDVDIVVELSRESLARLLAELPDEDYYVSPEAARDALRRHSMFNIVDMATVWKADLIVRKARPFSEAEFARRQRVRLLDVPVWVASPEDVIIAKLEWALKAGGSERQLADVAAVWAERAEDLDQAYIERWVAALGLQAMWARVQR